MLSLLYFLKDGRFVITASAEETAKIWDVKSGQLLQDLKGHGKAISSASFSQDGKFALTSSWDKISRIWNLNLLNSEYQTK